MRILLFLAAAILVFLAPSPRDTLPLLQGARSAADTVIVGNYAPSHRSRCDDDQRTVAMMMSDLQQSPVLDLSSPGQLVDESVNIAGLALQLTIALQLTTAPQSTLC